MLKAGALPPAVQPNASVAAIGLGIRYIGAEPMFVYAYSGQTSLTSGGGAISMLDFTSGSGIIVGLVQSGHDTTQMSASQTLSTEIQFNDVVVFDHLTLFTSSDTQTVDLGSPIHLIIPPFTRVKIIGATSDAGPIPTTYQLTGRVYGA